MSFWCLIFFQSHARAKKSRHFMLVEESQADGFLENLNQFKGIEKVSSEHFDGFLNITRARLGISH